MPRLLPFPHRPVGGARRRRLRRLAVLGGAFGAIAAYRSRRMAESAASFTNPRQN